MRRRSRRAEHRRCISATPQRLLWSIATGAEGDHFRSPISSSLPIDSTSLQVVRDDYALLGGASRNEGTDAAWEWQILCRPTKSINGCTRGNASGRREMERDEGGCTYARTRFIVTDQHVCPQGVIVGTGVIAIGMWSLLSPSDPPRCDRPIRQISKILFNSPECALRFTAERAFVGQGAASGAVRLAPSIGLYKRGFLRRFTGSTVQHLALELF